MKSGIDISTVTLLTQAQGSSHLDDVGDYENEQVLQSYASDVAAVRSRVLSQLTSTSPQCSQYLRQILEIKFPDSRGVGTPTTGEVYPWLLADYTGVPSGDITHLSLVWAYIYYYYIVVDYISDNENIDAGGNALMTISALAHEGFKALGEKTHDSNSSANNPHRAVRRSFRRQLEDIHKQSDTSVSIEDRQQYTKEKNDIAFVFSYLLSNKYEQKEDIITNSSELFVRLAQRLDDLKDYKEDYRRNNITSLIHKALDNKNYDIDEISGSNELLKVLVESGAIRETVSEIIDDLSKLLSFANSESLPLSRARLFIIGLYRRASSLNNEIERYNSSSQSLDNIKHYLTGVAFHT